MKRILIYLAFTFGIAWTIGFALYGLISQAPQLELFYAPVIAITMWTPTLAAWLSGRICKAERTIAFSFKPRFKNHVRYYLLAWLAPLVATLVGAAIYFLVFPENFSTSFDYISVTLATQGQGSEQVAAIPLSLIVLIQVVTALSIGPLINTALAIGEEIGWRGFLFPELEKQIPRPAAFVLIGIIWGVWHAPIIALFGHNYGLEHFGAPWVGIAMMCLSCFAFGTVLSWLVEKSGSIWPAALGHGALNAMAGLPMLVTTMDPAPELLLGPTLVGLVPLIPLLIVGIVLALRKKPVQMINSTNSYGIEGEDRGVQET
jgi:membrane protease YdiL (CAAX protease family)